MLELPHKDPPNRKPERKKFWFLLLTFSIVLSIFSFSNIRKLNIETRIFELLPENDPTSRDFKTFVEIFGGFEKILILFELSSSNLEDSETIEDTANSLVLHLSKSSLFKTIRPGITKDDEIFYLELLKNFPIYINPNKIPIKEIFSKSRIKARVFSFKSNLIGLPPGYFKKIFIADPFGFQEFFNLFASGDISLPIDKFSGYFKSSTGNFGLVIATPTVSELDSQSGIILENFLQESFESVKKEIGKDVTFYPLGGPLYAVQDERNIKTSMIKLSIFSGFIISILLFLFFRNFFLPAAIILSVFSGIIWTFGFAWFLEGKISVIGISLASILIGLGVDFGIHGANRFQQEIQLGRGATFSLKKAILQTGPPILVASATTIGAFLVLLFSDFKPLRELGTFVSIGIFFVIVSTFLTGGSVAIIFSNRKRKHPKIQKSYLSHWINQYVSFIQNHSWATIIIILGIIFISIPGLLNLQFDKNLKSMRPDFHSMNIAEQHLSEEFESNTQSFYIFFSDETSENSRIKAIQIKYFLESEFEGKIKVFSPADWLPPESQVNSRLNDWRIQNLPNAVTMLKNELENQGFNLSPFSNTFEVLEKISKGENPKFPSDINIPDWISDYLRKSGGKYWVALRIDPNENIWVNGPPSYFLEKLITFFPDVKIASIPLLGSTLGKHITSEFKKLAILSFIIIAMVIFLTFRLNFRNFLFSLLPVIFGFLVTLGICGIFEIPLNIFSIIVAPLVFGIGIDDGLHAIHGSLIHQGLSKSFQFVGPPIFITTLTTSIGFGVLIFSNIPALRHGGILISIGTLICLFATFSILPALDSLFPVYKKQILNLYK